MRATVLGSPRRLSVLAIAAVFYLVFVVGEIPHGRVVGFPDKSYKKECQEKNLSHRLNTVPLLSRHSALLFERHAYSESGLPPGECSCFVSACAAEIRFLSPVVPFRCRDGADRFLKQQA